MKHEVIFTREEGSKGVTTIGLCKFHAPGGGDSLALLQAAVTKWIESTESGEEAYKASAEDFNIGDLACCHTPGMLDKYGVLGLEVQILDPGDGVVTTYFDRHLYNGCKFS